MNHSFDVEIAQRYGLHSAIILQNMVFWIEKNKANDVHFHDGCYWTYNSVKAFGDLFPYLTAKQIRTALQKLEDDGLVKTGNYNSLAYDHTKWYALTEKGDSLFHIGHYDLPCRANGSDPKGKAIPDINTDINTDINIIGKNPKPKHFVKPTVAEVAAYCAERNNEIDAQYFVDYYEVRGWCAGKARMKDWKAAVRTWESNSKKKKSQATIKQSKPVGFNQGLKQFANAFSIGEQDDSSSFEEFWKVYPNKYGYGDAERVWNDIQPDAALAKRIIEIAGRITKVEKYSGDGAAFIPSPEKWLSGKHWEDEILQPPKTYSYEFTGINSNSVEENAKRTRVKVKVTEND